MEQPDLPWILHKIARLWRRFLTRDFIRRRPKRTQPPVGSSLEAHAIAYNDFGAYCVPLAAKHRPAARSIMAGRIWERATLDFIGSCDGHGDIVHAGAFFGDFFPLLSKAAGSRARVWAFEPNLSNYKAAQLTLSLNDIDNITLTRAGLGAQTGTGSLVVRNNRGLALGGASFVDDAGTDAAASEEIDIVALDSFLPAGRSVRMIQLDVEGYEQEALAGALGVIKRDRPVLLLETLPETAWFEDHLAPLGYARRGRVDENHIISTNE
ncbi:MAG: FkbM family methyltransferase [Hyphococcus sp.]